VTTALLAVLAFLVPLAVGGLASATGSQGNGPKPTIVLVHGDWADGSSWSGVIQGLQERGFTVVAPPNPLRGTDDASYVASYLATVAGPIVLVGHSYGGFVITNAASGNPKVKALVYIDAFIPDEGQTLGQLSAGSCLDPATAFNVVPSSGGAVIDAYLRIEPNAPYQGFAQCFANGVDPEQAAVLAAAQRPASLAQFSLVSGPPAWANIPAWSLIGTADRVITRAQQQAMSSRAAPHISTVNAGHLSYVSRPDAAIKVILAAVDATT
jgi:pimeloyl-ACP methyl ester carboxylesterase